MNFIIQNYNEEDRSKNIVRNVYFYNELSIRNSVREDQGKSEYFLQDVEGFIASVVEIPGDVLLNKMDK